MHRHEINRLESTSMVRNAEWLTKAMGLTSLQLAERVPHTTGSQSSSSSESTLDTLDTDTLDCAISLSSLNDGEVGIGGGRSEPFLPTRDFSSSSAKRATKKMVASSSYESEASGVEEAVEGRAPAGMTGDEAKDAYDKSESVEDEGQNAVRDTFIGVGVLMLSHSSSFWQLLAEVSDSQP